MRIYSVTVLIIIILCPNLLLSCGKSETEHTGVEIIKSEVVESQVKSREAGFHDVLKETGIDFVHTDGSCGRHYLVETVTVLN